MKVFVCGIDGYIDWPLSLYLARAGLISDRDYWNEWSQKSLQSVRRFDVSVIKEKVKELLFV